MISRLNAPFVSRYLTPYGRMFPRTLLLALLLSLLCFMFRVASTRFAFMSLSRSGLQPTYRDWYSDPNTQSPWDVIELKWTTQNRW